MSDKLSVAILNILQSNTTQLSCHGDQSKLFSFKNKVRKNYLFSFPPNFPFPIYHTQLLIFFCLYNFIIYAREKTVLKGEFLFNKIKNEEYKILEVKKSVVFELLLLILNSGNDAALKY